MIHPLTLIVSSYDRPEHLRLCLQSLKLQNRKDFFVTVTDASHEQWNRAVCAEYGHSYLPTPGMDCYTAAEAAARLTQTPYLGFPSDDNWYCPGFVERMLAATETRPFDLVACDMLYDPRLRGRYQVIAVAPRLRQIDKGGFLIRAEAFWACGGFPGKAMKCFADGNLVEAVMARSSSYYKVPEVLWYHG